MRDTDIHSDEFMQETIHEATDWARLRNLLVDMQDWYWYDTYVELEDGGFGVPEGSIYLEVDTLINELVDELSKLIGTKIAYTVPPFGEPGRRVEFDMAEVEGL